MILDPLESTIDITHYITHRDGIFTGWVNMDEINVKQQYLCPGHDCLENVFLALSRSFQREADLIQMKRGTWEMMFIGHFTNSVLDSASWDTLR